MTSNQPTLREAAVWAVLLVALYGAHRLNDGFGGNEKQGN